MLLAIDFDHGDTGAGSTHPHDVPGIGGHLSAGECRIIGLNPFLPLMET